MRITLRPTDPTDLAWVTNDPIPVRIRAITALAGDRVVGVGGLGYRADGTVIAFAHLTDELRRYPAAVHRAGVAGMRLIRAAGVRSVIAEAQPGNPAAEPWLLRFGFRPVEFNGHRAFVWERDRNVE